jgi:hypothetical protein
LSDDPCDVAHVGGPVSDLSTPRRLSNRIPNLKQDAEKEARKEGQDGEERLK